MMDDDRRQNSPSLSNSSRTVALSAASALSGLPKAIVTGYGMRLGNFVKNRPPLNEKIEPQS